MPLEESVRLLKYPVVSGRKIINIGWHRPLHSLGCSNTMTEWAQLYVPCSWIHRTESADGVFIGPSAHTSLDRLLSNARLPTSGHTHDKACGAPSPLVIWWACDRASTERGARWSPIDRGEVTDLPGTDANDAGGGMSPCGLLGALGVRRGQRGCDSEATWRQRRGDECYSGTLRSGGGGGAVVDHAIGRDGRRLVRNVRVDWTLDTHPETRRFRHYLTNWIPIRLIKCQRKLSPGAPHYYPGLSPMVFNLWNDILQTAVFIRSTGFDMECGAVIPKKNPVRVSEWVNIVWQMWHPNDIVLHILNHQSILCRNPRANSPCIELQQRCSQRFIGAANPLSPVPRGRYSVGLTDSPLLSAAARHALLAAHSLVAVPRATGASGRPSVGVSPPAAAASRRERVPGLLLNPRPLGSPAGLMAVNVFWYQAAIRDNRQRTAWSLFGSQSWNFCSAYECTGTVNGLTLFHAGNFDLPWNKCHKQGGGGTQVAGARTFPLRPEKR